MTKEQEIAFKKLIEYSKYLENVNDFGPDNSDFTWIDIAPEHVTKLEDVKKSLEIND